MADLARWAASERVARAAAERARTRSLAAQSEATATWAGILLDLAEREATVTVSIPGGRLSGRLVGVAGDFFVLESGDGHPVVVRTGSVGDLAPDGASGARHDGRSHAGGSRRPPIDLSLVAILEAVASESSPVTVRTAAGPVSGDLVALGEDVLTLRHPGPGRRVTHVPLAAVAACVLH